MCNSDLLVQIASGDETAFKELFENHRAKLFNYLLKITKSRQIAEEILIDVFLKIWMGREMIQEIKNLDAFLCKVAQNKALDYLRIASRNKELQQVISHEIMAGKEVEADSKLINTENVRVLNKVINHLSPQRRAIFNLSRVEGFTHDQIAVQLHLSPNTVRNTMAKTMQSIRQFLHANDVVGVTLFFVVFHVL